MATRSTASQTARYSLTWADVARLSDEMLARHDGVSTVYGIPTGGSVVASTLAYRIGLRLLNVVNGDAGDASDLLVVDDLVDSGKTLRPWVERGYRVDTMIRKPHSPLDIAPDSLERDGWVQFPWEHNGQPEDAVLRLLEYVGEDPGRDGLRGTPGRVCQALDEMTAGYKENPEEILTKTFEVDCDEMVALRGIRFASLCEHHLLPFTGQADVVYIPHKKVVGISKLARLVQCFARRLQIQERMTQEIAHAIHGHLQPLGVGVVIRAHHHCMGCRGVRQPDAEMVTSAMLGFMRNDEKARAEALALCGWNKGN